MNQDCMHWPIFEGLNDWQIATLVAKEPIEPHNLDELCAEVLGGIAAQMEELT